VKQEERDVCSACMKKFDEKDLIVVQTPLGPMKFCKDCVVIQVKGGDIS